MLKNKLYLYGNDAEAKLPAHLHIGKYMLNKFKTFGDHDAIINAATDERMTFKELTQLVVDISLSLVHIGVKNGDVVTVCSENVMEFLPVVYGTVAAGATFSALDASCAGLSAEHRLNIGRPKILFCSPSTYNKNKAIIASAKFVEKVIIFGEPIDEAIGFKEFLTQHADVDDFDTVPVKPLEDPALILFSSGTTGMPKGIKMTHYNCLIFLHTWYGEVYTGAKCLVVIDWYISYGQTSAFFFHQMGVCLVFCNNADEKRFMEVVQDYKINVIPSTPTGINSLLKLQHKYDISSLTSIFVTGAPTDVAMLQAIKEKQNNSKFIYQFYWLSETGTIASPRRAPNTPPRNSVGCVRDLFVVKIVDLDSKKPVGANQRGEIRVKSPSITTGYIGGPVDVFDEEGFFKTGDIGYYDDTKNLYVIDRIKDIIKYDSFTLPPAEMEAVLLQHPAVLEAGVVGAPHESLGELPTAFVVLHPGATVTEKELVDFVNEQMSIRMPLAGGVRFIDQMPRCIGVKIDKKKLKLMLQQK